MAKTEIIAEPGAPQIIITRAFDAPRELLFRAYTDPDLLVQWLGPRRMTMTIDRYDVRDGGRWRFIHRDGDGNEYAFHGIFHGMPSPDGIVRTFEFEGLPGHVSLETATFEERDSRTVLRLSSIFQSVEDRDGMAESGMRDFAPVGMAQLQQVARSL